jgi:hypothetical protein
MRQARDGAARLRRALRHTLRLLANHGTIDWISATLLATVSERSFPVCVMLAWSKARPPQVLRISLSQVRSGSAIRIPASNGGLDRYMAGRPVGGQNAWADVDTTTSWMTCDGESLQRDIARARRECLVERPPGLWDETELFRYLWASGAFANGLSREEIARELGYPRAAGASAFIHPIETFLP